MLLKVSVVSNRHFVHLKPKITHCNEALTLSEYLNSVVLDNGQKLNISKLLEVLIGAGSFKELTNFDLQSLEVVTIEELKASLTGGLFFNYFIFDFARCQGFFLSLVGCLNKFLKKQPLFQDLISNVLKVRKCVSWE